MRWVVLTGMSGSGKTTALDALEDLEYYAIDNLPIRLLDQLVELFAEGDLGTDKVALVVDARSCLRSDPQDLFRVPTMLQNARAAGHDVELVFFDATNATLERRYSETRRKHPLAKEGSVAIGIERERALLVPLREAATSIIDSSTLSVHELRKKVQDAYAAGEAGLQMSVTVQSFGFKFGLPPESDLVFDVRFLANPHFVEALRPLTGLDQPVADFVWSLPQYGTFMGHLTTFLEYLLPQYRQEGKAYLTIGIGCTGGRHRSVSVARQVADWTRSRGYQTTLRHRDIDR
ncbi:MAG: RNase adapter RapZ [Myxococcales bacterium]|nr:RNase adapter RapZ [Myxococcales bacterium]